MATTIDQHIAEKEGNIWIIAAPYSKTYKGISTGQIAESYWYQAYVAWDKQFEVETEITHCEGVRVPGGYLKTIIDNHFKTFKGVPVTGAVNHNVIYTKKHLDGDDSEWPHGEAVKVLNPHVDKISIVNELISFYRKYDWTHKIVFALDISQDNEEELDKGLLKIIAKLREK